jgi:cellulose synthase/poly-beta-1,6-N-acetylglucosamine synthase-like glycosyltransferase
MLSKGKSQNSVVFTPDEDSLPTISILLAAYNEERVIGQKIVSTMKSSYPLHKIEFLIGSDASTDGTNAIIEKYAAMYPQLRLYNFAGRTGKAGIVNQLSDIAKNEIFILTDANVFFKEDTIYKLAMHYKDPDIALVGGNILNIRLKRDGISVQEKSYLERENLIKYQEGVLWGTMIGAFGGCYSVRRSHYDKVPPRFFMDDFYITMHALEKGGRAINEISAISYEDISNKISEEFRRKVRISIGNFQNLSRYAGLLWPVYRPLGFSFLSHKVFRWLGPVFLIIMFISSGFLMMDSLFYRWLFVLQLLGLLSPVADYLLKKLNIHSFLLRLASHFYTVNLALLIGLFRFMYGVKTNIWKPTERFQ